MANEASRKMRLMVISVLAATTLQGCSVFSFGESEYACSGIPDGVSCMSARDVYELTNNGNVPRPVDEDGNVVASKGQSNESTEDQVRIIEDRYVAPTTPAKPVPIRTPAKVMRVWVSPWEDTDGNLNISSYVYTEIEPRRWVYDNQERPSQSSIKPLQIIQKKEAGGQDAEYPEQRFFSGEK
ncbi:type IV conjugative transfer system lipoprotein TraV [Hydrocarboniclastica marina]|uniref:Type IV conjugative transfer system protein TraV n=1 Tax=Hydrocarboniclastica marina TaxID=2259620 RepID=A0A4P7XLK7_9ALTE|nr:type IV conjugative transfer system lipoprotein TraV [Hydrocarboniclastica marina]QCF28136.1 type IV conjugative transfer system protein TraV [Hydrocarboniclastica marina]